MYVHLTARSTEGLLFHDWTEALALWRRLVAAFPDARALCLMPNHPHVVVGAERARERLSGVMSGYARWRRCHRGEAGPVWVAQPPPESLADRAHVRRMIRYVHLNPCRAGLASDPLAWPLSTHRDQCGLGTGERARDPDAFHTYVSGDPTVTPEGTTLPGVRAGPASLLEVEAAVGAVLRVEPREVRARPDARRLFVRAAWLLHNRDPDVLGEWLDVHRATIFRAIADRPSLTRIVREPRLHAVLRVTGDPRFGALELAPWADGRSWSAWRR